MLLSTFVSLVSVASALDLFGNKWVRGCKNGDTRALRSANCDALGKKGMSECLKVPKNDETIATVIFRCPTVLPDTRRAISKSAYRLFITEMPLSFRALLAHGRCRKVGRKTLKRILTSLVYSKSRNAERFVKAISEKCHLRRSMRRNFYFLTRSQGRLELAMALREGRSRRMQIFGTHHSHQVNQKHVSVLRSKKVHENHHKEEEVTSEEKKHKMRHLHRHCNKRHCRHRLRNGHFIDIVRERREHSDDDAKDLSMPSELMGTFKKNPMKVTAQEVKKDLLILTRLTPKQAEKFGILSEGCLGITESHLRQPGLSAELVGNLPLRCFEKIPPNSFAGLSAQMIRRIRWWPYVTRDQIRYIHAGDEIRAVPFDQMGMGRQRDAEDREHPCWTITPDQLRAIRKSKLANGEYRRRCVRSAANTLSSSLYVLPLIILSITKLLIL